VRRVFSVTDKIRDPTIRGAYLLKVPEWLAIEPAEWNRAVEASRKRPERASDFEEQRLPPPAHGNKLTVGQHLLTLIAVRPEALDRIRAQVSPELFDEDDRRTYLRMLETFTGGGLDELQASLEKYEEHEQELIRRAWASPPPRVDDEYVDGLVWKVRYEALQSELRGVRRKLGEAEQRGDRDQVALLVTEDRRLAMAVEQHKSEKGS
jgi:hypothetical protein